MIKGDIYLVNFDPVVGSEQGGLRPALLISNNLGNKHSPCVTVAVITTRNTKSRIPTHVWLSLDNGLRHYSMVECEQVRTVDKSRLTQFIGHINPEDSDKVDKALKISFNLT